MEKTDFEKNSIVIGERILLRIIKKGRETTKSGLIISVANDQKTNRAEVISIGLDCGKKGLEEKEINLKEGDIVIYDKFSGHEIIVDNINYLVLPYSDILLIEPRDNE